MPPCSRLWRLSSSSKMMHGMSLRWRIRASVRPPGPAPMMAIRGDMFLDSDEQSTL